MRPRRKPTLHRDKATPSHSTAPPDTKPRRVGAVAVHPRLALADSAATMEAAAASMAVADSMDLVVVAGSVDLAEVAGSAEVVADTDS